MPVIFGGFVIRARPLTSELVPEFCRYAFRQPDVREQIIKRSQGAIRSNIGQGELSQVEINLPPLPEQQKIADILSTWDKAIQTTEALLANARTQKRALMQSLLTGTRRFPGFEDHPWREVRLGEVLEITYGKSPKEIFVDCGEYPVIGTGGETGRTNTVMAQGPAIIIGRKGTIDSPQWVEGGFWCIDTTYYCYAKGGNVLRWLFAWLGSINLKDFNEASGVPSLSRETLRAITLKLPSVPEQHLIAKVMIDIETDITTIRAQLDHLRTEKKSLMQQLLTGKRRVVV
jgi:type I restriction enzyme S subunit